MNAVSVAYRHAENVAEARGRHLVRVFYFYDILNIGIGKNVFEQLGIYIYTEIARRFGHIGRGGMLFFEGFNIVIIFLVCIRALALHTLWPVVVYQFLKAIVSVINDSRAVFGRHCYPYIFGCDRYLLVGIEYRPWDSSLESDMMESFIDRLVSVYRFPIAGLKQVFAVEKHIRSFHKEVLCKTS